GLAELGELVRHVRDRTVLLAELLADRSLADRRGVAALGERPGQRLGRLQTGTLRHNGVVDVLNSLDATPGEREHGLVAPGLRHEPERLDGQGVVLLDEPVPAGLGDREDLGRTAPAPGPVDPGLARLD